MRSEQSDEQSAEQLQEVDHPEARITHRGICASPDTIFGGHRYASQLPVCGDAGSIGMASDRRAASAALPTSRAASRSHRRISISAFIAPLAASWVASSACVECRVTLADLFPPIRRVNALWRRPNYSWYRFTLCQ